jgi:hypothetical protein
LQFYRTNRDISAEIKAAIKLELSRARNNFKAVFVSNYYDWISYESNGTPRLNKFSRKLLMTHCTFAAKQRESLAMNPQFAESLKRFNFKMQQREHQLERLIQKIKHSGTTVPQELLDELKFVKS